VLDIQPIDVRQGISALKEANMFGKIISRSFMALLLMAAFTLTGCGQVPNDSNTSEFASSGVSGGTSGTSGYRGRGRHGDRATLVTERLGLDEAQQAALADLQASHKGQIDALVEAAKAEEMDRGTFAAQVKAVSESYGEGFLAILSDEQKVAWEEVQASMENFKGRRGRGHRKGNMRAEVIEKLGLTEDQQASLANLETTYRDQVEALIKSADEDPDREALHEEVKALGAAFQDAFVGLLTDEQKAAYDELQASIAGRSGFHGRGFKRGHGRTSLVDELGLNEDQVAALTELRASLHDDAKAIFESDYDADTKREQLEALHTEMTDGLLALLTEEQRAKYDELVSGT
jgi:hypothetical protein